MIIPSKERKCTRDIFLIFLLQEGGGGPFVVKKFKIDLVNTPTEHVSVKI